MHSHREECQDLLAREDAHARRLATAQLHTHLLGAKESRRLDSTNIGQHRPAPDSRIARGAEGRRQIDPRRHRGASLPVRTQGAVRGAEVRRRTRSRSHTKRAHLATNRCLPPSPLPSAFCRFIADSTPCAHRSLYCSPLCCPPPAARHSLSSCHSLPTTRTYLAIELRHLPLGVIQHELQRAPAVVDDRDRAVSRLRDHWGIRVSWE